MIREITFLLFIGNSIPINNRPLGQRCTFALTCEAQNKSCAAKEYIVRMCKAHFGSRKQCKRWINGMSKKILSLLVENEAGVLSRVSGLFSRRGYNIDSLSVGGTEVPGISRMTIVTSGDAWHLSPSYGKTVNVISSTAE